MARGPRVRGSRSRAGGGLGLDLEWSWGRGFNIPEEVMSRQDKEKIANIILSGVQGRAPVVTGRFKASLFSKVLKRRVNVRSKLKYMRKLNYDMTQQGAPFAFFSDKEMDQSVAVAQDALNRFLKNIRIKGDT